LRDFLLEFALGRGWHAREHMKLKHEKAPCEKSGRAKRWHEGHDPLPWNIVDIRRRLDQREAA
jgi:hypothetical protein